MDAMNPTSLQTSTLQWQGQAEAAKIGQMQKQAGSNDEKKLRQASKDFEAVFVNQMLEAMDKTVDRDHGFLNGGSSEQYFRSMLNEEISKSMTNRVGGSGFGLAEAIYRQMSGHLPAPTKSSSEAETSTGVVPSVSAKTGEVKP